MSLSKYGSINFNNLDKLIKHKESFKVGSLIEMIIEELNLNKIFPNVGNIWELLIDLGNSFGNNISLFLEHIILGREIDFYPFKTDKVSLLSLHASKGMEFKVVFLVGCEESLIPYTLENSDLEEERRLFFVGMTRAKIYLYLSYAKNRIIYGKRYKNRASPFLLEIEDSLKSFSKGDIFRKKEEKQLSLFSLK
jgi:DNA helicase-2/ATP-dependent DNA helicase PcrA